MERNSSEDTKFNSIVNFLKQLKIPTLLDEPSSVKAEDAPTLPEEIVEPETQVPTEEAGEATDVVQTFNDKKRVLHIKKQKREANQNLRKRQTSSQMAGLNPLGIKSGLNIPMV